MKKIVLTSVCAFGATIGVLAQGTFNWSTISPAYFTVQTNSTTFYGGVSTGSGSVGATAAEAGAFYYELLWSASVSDASSLSSIATWTDSGLEAQSAASAGRVSPLNGNTSVAVAGWAPNTTANAVIVGWSANLGSTWANALAALQANSWTGEAYFGASSVATLTSGSANPGQTIFSPTGINSKNTQLYLVPVPEPTTIALAGLGAISLLGLRRKK